MPKQLIPERDPVSDTVSGSLIEAKNTQAFVIGEFEPTTARVIAQGRLIVRYGVRFLGKPHLSIVPGLIAVDYGTFLNGAAAWDFLIKRSNLYPRAEVFGFRNDGRDEMMLVKALDLALPIAVIIYTDANATIPVGQPSALIVPPSLQATLPPHLLEYLPHYAAYDDWQKAIEHP